MAKTRLLLLLIVLMSAFALAAPVIDTDSISMSDMRNERKLSFVDSQFELHNDQVNQLQVEISGLILKDNNDNTQRLDLVGTGTDFVLGPEATKIIRIRADVTNTKAGTYTGTIILTDENTNTATVPVTLTVSKEYDYDIDSESKVLILDTNNQIKFNITNNGNHDETIAIKLNGLATGSDIYPLSSTPQTIQLNSGQIRELTFDVGLADSITASLYRLEVELDSQNSDYNEVVIVPSYRVREKTTDLELSPDHFEAQLSADKKSFNLDFKIENTGEQDLDDIEVEFNEIQDGLEVTGMPSDKISITAGTSRQITLQVSSLSEIKDGNIAEIRVDSKEIGSPLREIIKTPQAQMLKVDRVKLFIASDTDTIKSSGQKFDEDIKPGSSISGEIKVCNEYPSRSKVDITGIDIEMLIKDIDDGRDFEDDTRRDFNLDAGDCVTRDLEFEEEYLPFDAEENDYDLLITVTGSDDIGYYQETNFTVELEIEREKDDMLIQKFYSTPSEVSSCFDTQAVALAVKLYNIGSDDQDNLRVKVTSDQLNYKSEQLIREMEADRDNEETLTFDYIVPSDLSEGSYEFLAEVFLEDELDPIEVATFELNAISCDGSIQSQYEENLKLLEQLNNPNNRQVIDTVSMPLVEDLVNETEQKAEDLRERNALIYTAMAILIVFILAIGLIMLLML